MNSIYKIVFNKATQTFTAVSELAKGATKTQSQSAKQAGTFLPKFAKITLAISMVLGFSTSVMAGTVVSGSGTATGTDAASLGSGTVASGDYSTAMGYQTEASGKISTAMGYKSVALGFGSLATGGKVDSKLFELVKNKNYDKIKTDYKDVFTADVIVELDAITDEEEKKKFTINKVEEVRELRGGKAYADGSMALGTGTIAGVEGGQEAVAMGFRAKATGNNSMALGFGSEATGVGAVAIGSSARNVTDSKNLGAPVASGVNSFAFGAGTKAKNYSSIALGEEALSSGAEAVSIGYKTQAIGNHSLAMGTITQASGMHSTAMGANTKALGIMSTAMGYQTEASGKISTAMGYKSVALGFGSLATGGKVDSKLFELVKNKNYDKIKTDYKDVFTADVIVELDAITDEE
ncbi:ESPR-type extended signal peptide-containing protein, partial [Phocoenobacter skyensis]